MPYKNRIDHNKQALNFYHSHPEYRKKQLADDRLRYWRKKVIDMFGTELEHIKDLTENQLKALIKGDKKND